MHQGGRYYSPQKLSPQGSSSSSSSSDSGVASATSTSLHLHQANSFILAAFRTIHFKSELKSNHCFFSQAIPPLQHRISLSSQQLLNSRMRSRPDSSSWKMPVTRWRKIETIVKWTLDGRICQNCDSGGTKWGSHKEEENYPIYHPLQFMILLKLC